MRKAVKNKWLLVEGKDDKHVILALCKKFSVAETFDVVDCEGFEKLIEGLPNRIKTKGLEAIGVIIDADQDLNSRWQSAKNIFKSQGFTLQEEFPKDDKLMPIVNATLEDIEKKGLNKYAPIHRSKAKIHTWLSWQESPGTPLGASITKKTLTTESETCVQFADWLKRLFEN